MGARPRQRSGEPSRSCAGRNPSQVLRGRSSGNPWRADYSQGSPDDGLTICVVVLTRLSIFIQIFQIKQKRSTMARTDRDRWDLATSVGATATMVAAQRAISSDEKLIDDPYAAPLVRAVGIDVYVRLVNGQIPVEGDTGFDPRRMAQGMAARTRFYDQFFLDAAQSGVAQAVILASGLDARAYRLPWPAGTVVYEVDMPEVIEFKTVTLSELGAEPTAQRRTVSVDLRDDWGAALQASGFDPQAPA